MKNQKNSQMDGKANLFPFNSKIRFPDGSRVDVTVYCKENDRYLVSYENNGLVSRLWIDETFFIF